jgi:hypothetical protein
MITALAAAKAYASQGAMGIGSIGWASAAPRRRAWTSATC